MTIDKKLDTLLDHCGITPGPWRVSNEYSTMTIVEPCGFYNDCWYDDATFEYRRDNDQIANARLIAQSRENIKALIRCALRHLERYGYEHPRLPDRIEASIPMTWEEIKIWLEGCDERN